MAKYKTYTKLEISGDAAFVTAVTQCLDVIDTLADGHKLLQAIDAKSHVVTITPFPPGVAGNQCSALADSVFPIMLLAIDTKNAANFRSELNVAINKAKLSGITLEHLARQLSVGLTPATYVGAANVVRPAQKNPAPASVSGHGVMMHAALQTSDSMTVLQDLMSGKRTLAQLPKGWDYELPRLLRPYLTAGRGGGSKIDFSPTKTFHCVEDKAMYKRPPAVGLAHELIHALHNSRGVNFALVEKNQENIEELITTGMAPYNFEEISDNKLRTQWPDYLHLRENY